VIQAVDPGDSIRVWLAPLTITRMVSALLLSAAPLHARSVSPRDSARSGGMIAVANGLPDRLGRVTINGMLPSDGPLNDRRTRGYT